MAAEALGARRLEEAGVAERAKGLVGHAPQRGGLPGARRQVVGVSEPGLLPLIAGALRELGHERALVVHGSPGMDEISPLGPTRVAELDRGEVHEYDVDPGGLGFEAAEPAEIRGGTPDENARVIAEVFAGRERGGARTAVAVNAGGALYVGGRAEDLARATRLAQELIDSGAAGRTLDRLREESAAARSTKEG